MGVVVFLIVVGVVVLAVLAVRLYVRAYLKRKTALVRKGIEVSAQVINRALAVRKGDNDGDGES